MILCDRLKLHIVALNDRQVSQTSKRSPSTKSGKSRTFILAIALSLFWNILLKNKSENVERMSKLKY